MTKPERVNFVAATVHELKTSLTAIIVSAELLADELKPDEKSVLGRLIQSIIRNAHSIDERLSLLAEAGGFLAEIPRFQPKPVAIGDVIQEGDRIYGDGVNIAARLEGLAEPGGICISRTAYDQIEDKHNESVGQEFARDLPKPEIKFWARTAGYSLW